MSLAKRLVREVRGVPRRVNWRRSNRFDGLEANLINMIRSRRDGRSTNGTLTFRRASATPQSLSQSSTVPESALPTSLADTIPAPQTTSAPTNPAASRYSKDQLLGLFRSTSGSQEDVSRLFMDGWNPGAGHVNGGASRGWGKTQEYNTGPDSDLCWNGGADQKPLAFREMSADEKEVRLFMILALPVTCPC